MQSSKIDVADPSKSPPVMMHRIAEQIKLQWLDALTADSNSGDSDNQSRKEAA